MFRAVQENLRGLILIDYISITKGLCGELFCLEESIATTMKFKSTFSSEKEINKIMRPPYIS